jgi:hypothetical protein
MQCILLLAIDNYKEAPSLFPVLLLFYLFPNLINVAFVYRTKSERDFGQVNKYVTHNGPDIYSNYLILSYNAARVDLLLPLLSAIYSVLSL